MSINVVPRKALWGRSGNRCAFTDCWTELIPAEDEITREALTEAGLIVGEEAHIRGKRADSARHDAAYAEVDSYANLILLCPTHHTVIDKDDVRRWPVERIEKLKADHEKLVRERMSQSEAGVLETQILVAADVQRIEDPLFTIWPFAYWQLTRPVPLLSTDHFETIAKTGAFLLAKDWPDDYPLLAAASERVWQVIRLLTDHIAEAFEPTGAEEKSLRLVRGEKNLRAWDDELYAELFHETQLGMVATWWLADTLTLELNEWIRAVRKEVDRHYRWAEGVILVQMGDGIIDPLSLARLDYGPVLTLPTLPRSHDEIKACAEARAAEQGVDPQRLSTGALSFPFPDVTQASADNADMPAE
ncbi:MAG: HNH endonuclease [Cellulosimicrobium funkei]|uniref:HNH endonuclease n=1 Tax=Cellulosimicrobium cellulans TaxID=1710 RepID=A0ABX5XB13_CELCE|nr:HNH endonuclease [Cellulosimicrobium cellulans]QDP75335.1 HNH endonuclease [Cellulosimicrobium cellulans]